ncbi:MAG: glycosyltransferase family 4 protein [Bdellovibrionales bacterium]|nr:glycosyltransferase family 4 protein [Bdellovibrionales bacterium]NQZ18753.1 glycosyltransferase family 4 protein [Bdellovibrionales bacterium]
MKKRAYFVISTQLGGAERSLIDFLKNTSHSPDQQIVVVPKSTGPLIDEISLLHIRPLTLPIPPFVLSLSRKRKLKTLLSFFPLLFFSFSYIFRIYNFIRKEKVEVIHSTGIKFHIWLCITSLIARKTQFHIHMRDVISSPLIKTFFSFFNSMKNVHFISNSKVTAQSLEQENSLIVYNGFDSKDLYPDTSNLKQSLKISEDTLLIGIVGVIAQWKGQRLFLEMAAKLQHKNPDLHFIIVGDEIYDTTAENGELSLLQKKQKDLKLTNLHFIGFQKNIKEVYQGLDLLVHGSLKPEPFGRVIVEAMLCECPVIAANQGGPLEIIESGISGQLYKAGNLNDLTDKAQTLLNDTSLRQSLGKKGRQKALYFSMDTYIEALDSQLNKF